MAHSQGLIPPGLVRVPPRAALPELGRVDFVLTHATRHTPAKGSANALATRILQGGVSLHTGR